MQALRRCNYESFWYRCFPIAAGLSVATHLAVQNGKPGTSALRKKNMINYMKLHSSVVTGYLRPSPRFGSTPKILLATLAGYVIGKISYRKRCAEMIMELPNSKLGEAMRRNRELGGRQARISEE
jgi:hypothetical protein